MRVPCVIEFPCDSGYANKKRPLGRLCLYRKVFACVLFDAKPTDDVNEWGNNSLHPVTVKQYIGTFPSTLGMGEREFATSLSSIYTPLLQGWILQKPHHTHTHTHTHTREECFRIAKGVRSERNVINIIIIRNLHSWSSQEPPVWRWSNINTTTRRDCTEGF